MLYEFHHHDVHSSSARVVPSPAPGRLGADGEPSVETDEQLLARVQARDEAALCELLRRHKPLLRAIIGRVVHADADIDDVLQEVSCEIWNRAEAFSPEKGRALGWVITMTRRRAIDRVRRRQAYDHAEERLRLASEHTTEKFCDHTAAADADHADLAEALGKLLNTLPEAQRETVRLTFYEGLSQREIAMRTGIPLGTIKTRIELGIRKLRHAMATMGGADEWSRATAA